MKEVCEKEVVRDWEEGGRNDRGEETGEVGKRMEWPGGEEAGTEEPAGARGDADVRVGTPNDLGFAPPHAAGSPGRLPRLHRPDLMTGR